MTIVYSQKSRALLRDIVMADGDNVTITPVTGDKLRLTIGRTGETAKLTITSGTLTANGSAIMLGASSRLTIFAADLTFDPGVYSFIVDFYDLTDRQWKTVEREVFVLEE